MIRLFVDESLSEGARFPASDAQAHYLFNVMRLAAGAAVLLFNGRDGEWRAEIEALSRRSADFKVLQRTRSPSLGPDLELWIALIKRGRLESVVEKAAELGARRVRLILTERTNAGHTRVDRLAAIAIEAAEQTGRLEAPEIAAPLSLAAALAGLEPARRVLFCDEMGEAPPALEALAGGEAGAWAVLVGPEGGFSPEERAMLRARAEIVPVSLGPRILRADTAAFAALALWQAALGDWRSAGEPLVP